MVKNGFHPFHYLSSVLLLSMSILCISTDGDRKVYIVYMGSLPEEQYSPSSHHLRMLQEVLEDSLVENVLVRSYNRSFNGFAAKLTNHERQTLAGMKEVVSVYPSRTLQLHTTRSWDFMGFDQSIIRKRSVESDMIVGVIDSGIWPESDSFRDEGFGPAPKRWKGACKGGRNFTCNNKIIGARYYTTERPFASARDLMGHGSHTASTAAGNNVKDASFYGLGQGTARGAVPSARIAAYKTCDIDCDEVDILAAFDDAIADGVDLITISLGPLFVLNLTEDSIAIGAFHAMEKGILTLQSAGNEGPVAGRVVSVAPWLVSVAASTTDRLYIDKVALGNGKTPVGYSINSFTLNGTKLPLVHGPEVSSHCTRDAAELCQPGCVDSSLVKGKIVLCAQNSGDSEALRAGAAGVVLLDDRSHRISSIVPLPASGLSPDKYKSVISYVKSTKNPQAEILKTEVIKDSTAPIVAYCCLFLLTRTKLHCIRYYEDISAPGVNILAAYSLLGPVSWDIRDKRQVKYTILTGTSMSCPHAAGVAAYVKSFHPDWSPSAIKSAIMTTAWPMTTSKYSGAEFAYGSGHINPVKAINPGLVYEAFKRDYIKMLCSMGYDVDRLRIISGDKSICPRGSDKGSPKDLNYPSMTAKVSAEKPYTISFRRTVMNVGLANSTYNAKVLQNPKISVTVVPEVLSFSSFNEKKSFEVTVTGGGLPYGKFESASLVWYDGIHRVRSPIVVHTIH